MNSTPAYFELCVLIPCYNNVAGLKKSIASIAYDKGKYLILVVDDGSASNIDKNDIIPGGDHQIPLHIIRLPENKGITVALNTGLHWIRDSINCDYIARLDCGDTCDPQRFIKQIDFLRINTDIVLLGTWCYFQDPKKNIKFNFRTPVRHKDIQRALYFRNVFIHPTIVVRYRVIEEIGVYPEQYPYAEDYAWFWKIANRFKTAIFPAYLVVCEQNTTGLSESNRAKQLQSRMLIIKEFGHKFALKQLAILKTLILTKIPYSIILNIKRLLSF